MNNPKAMLALIVVLSCGGCGKYGPPLPPEAVSPTNVSELAVSASGETVTISWEAPGSDRRGKNLADIEGYRVYRKTISRRGDIYDDAVPYVLISEVKDEHLQLLAKKKAEAEAEGRPTRRIKADPKDLVFSYSDLTAKSGEQYIYRVTPVNNGGVEGRTAKLIRADLGQTKHEFSVIDNLKDERIDLNARVEIK